MILSTPTLAAIAGLAGGLVLGFAARWGSFCSLGAIEDLLFSGDTRRARMWCLSIAIAIASTYALDHNGLINISQSIYLAQPASLLATIVGAGLFGLGMALVGTCGHGTLARIGGGDLKSIVTFLVMGISAYATMRGLTAYLRLALFDSPQATHHSASIADTLSATTGLTLHFIAYVIAATLVALAFFRDRAVRRRQLIITGTLVGLTISWGWLTTGWLSRDVFDPYPLTSYTFSAPLGESIVYIMTMTGATLKFGIGATAGVIIGAALTALSRGQFRWEACDDATEMRRQIIGGILMGFGSVTALGCTIGQGLSAASVLSISAPLAIASMIAGAWFGLKLLIDGSFLAFARRSG